MFEKPLDLSFMADNKNQFFTRNLAKTLNVDSKGNLNP